MDRPESRPQPSGLTAEGASLFDTVFSSVAKKDDDWWIRAEKETAELITSIQPIRLSEKRRNAIANFVEHLIKSRLDCIVQVETFGSVALKTYLPDGDIDLTALSFHTDLKETWAQDVVKALKRAEEDPDAEFRVKEVQYIQAEVKIIKCLVENIVVDISFNQTGGLYTFFFLEEVDRYIAQNHLFKRSIILVKAWCYYESRILGAHHGLISTYALETLVLYIFHVFHSSLRGPLEVLYTFLVYFSNFDWDKYCVSLWGPLPLTTLIITHRVSADFAESPRNDGGRLLLTKEFLERCVKEYSGVSIGQDSNQGRDFNTKYLNVLDPIRETNNLGRSVNVGSFKRIRSAFGLGARTLGEALECSEDQINEKFKSFFSCTFKSLERYRSAGRPDTASDTIKPERVRATEASLAQSIPSNLNAVNPDGQWRQIGGKGRHTNVEGDIARGQNKVSNHYTPQEHFDRSMPVNRRSSEDHDHVLFRSPVAGEYQSRAPGQDSPRWASSRGDSVGQGGAARSRNVSDPNLSLSNHDAGRPPGPSGDFKTNSSHGNFNRKVPSGDENDMCISGRKVVPAEQRKGSSNHWSGQQRVFTPSGDVSYQGSGQDSSSQSMLRHIPPYSQNPPPGYLAQMHLPVSSAMPVPASSLAGPPSALPVHVAHHSSSSGESIPSRTSAYMSMQEPRILPPSLPATSSLMIPVSPSGESPSSSHNGGFSLHGEEQREHWRPPLEDQKQALHRASVTSKASPGHSLPTGSTSPTESCPSPFSAAPLVLPEPVMVKFKPTQGGPPSPVEIGEFSRIHGPMGDSLSQLSMSDERPGEASSQLEEGVLETRSRENRPHSSDVKTSGEMRVKGTNGTELLSRSQSSSDECELEVVRSVDGHAELRRHWLSQPSLEETSVGGRQGAPVHVPSYPSSSHSQQELLLASPPSYPQSPAILSSAPQPAVTIPCQSPLQVPSTQAVAGPSFTLEGQVLPVSVGGPGVSSGPLHAPIIEHAPVSTGPGFRNRPMEAAPLHVTLTPPMFYVHGYPPFFVMPTGTDGGVIRGESMGDLHSNGSMDFSANIHGSQSPQDLRARMIPQVGMNFAGWPKGTGAVVSPSNKMEASHVERISEDILFSDQKDQKEQLLQLFQNSCIYYSNSNFASMFQQVPHLWEGSGRLKANLNSHIGLNISHPPGVAGPSYSSRGRVPDGMQQPRGFPIHGNEDTLPKPRVGTGAYLPHPRHTHTNRERSGPGGRGGNQHGSYVHQDRNNLEESNQSYGSRYRSSGQGQVQPNKHEPRAQTMPSAQKNPAPALDRESTVEKRAQPPVSSLPPSTPSQAASAGHPITSSNGYSGVGTSAPSVIMQQLVNDGSMGFSPELEFGSLGPFQPG